MKQYDVVYNAVVKNNIAFFNILPLFFDFLIVSQIQSTLDEIIRLVFLINMKSNLNMWKFVTFFVDSFCYENFLYIKLN